VKIDLSLEKCEFGDQRGLVHVGVSGSWSAVAAIAPPRAATFQGIFQLERRLLSPHAHRRLAGSLQRKGERWSARGRQFVRQNLEQGVAVIMRQG
jgi:hypothetical protein